MSAVAAAGDRADPPGREPRVAFSAFADQDEPARSKRLALLAQTGDEQAFGQLYGLHFDRVCGYLRLVFCDDTHTAEDIAQEAFARAFSALSGFEAGSTPFGAWIIRIARNAAIDRLRRDVKLQFEDPQRLADQRDAWQRPIDGDLLGSIGEDTLTQLIAGMPRTQRQVIVLRYVFDLSHREVARVLGRSPAAVRMLQSRAFENLETRLRALGHAPVQPEADRGGVEVLAGC